MLSPLRRNSLPFYFSLRHFSDGLPWDQPKLPVKQALFVAIQARDLLPGGGRESRACVPGKRQVIATPWGPVAQR